MKCKNICMNRIISVLLSIVLILSCCAFDLSNFSASAATGNTTEFAGGSGTTDDPI